MTVFLTIDPRRGRLRAGLATLVVALLGITTIGAAATEAAQANAARRVTVTAGKPSEFKFALSSHRLRHGSVSFTIRNRGALVHDFKVCTARRRSASANSCKGKSSIRLGPGKSAKLTVRFTKKGTYEYLCTLPGHAAAGMKGLLVIT